MSRGALSLAHADGPPYDVWPRRKKSEKIGEISPIYCVSTGSDTTNGGDKSAGRFFAKNRQKIGDISATQDKSVILSKNRLRIPCVADLSAIYRRFFGDFLRKIVPLSPA